MKKKLISFISFSLLVLFVLFLYFNENVKNVRLILNDNSKLCLSLNDGSSDTIIESFFDESEQKYILFIPAYVNHSLIYKGSSRIVFDDTTKNLSPFLSLDTNTEYNIKIDGSSTKLEIKELSEIPSLFLDIKPSKLNSLKKHKDNYVNCNIKLFNPNGELSYAGTKDKIKGHGNVTWDFDKKPFKIKLDDEAAWNGTLNKEWTLLNLAYDGDKIHTKLALDMAEGFGMPYSNSSHWANLYINGDFQGLYLIAESAGTNVPLRDTGAFLLEKELSYRKSKSDTYIYSQNGEKFVLKGKDYTDEETFEIIEALDEVYNNLSENKIPDSLDLLSFAKQFLVDEISLNYDAFKTSCYFYREKESGPICAGPSWDYDASFGEYLHKGTAWINTNGTVIDKSKERFTWYKMLSQNDSFKEKVSEVLDSSIPMLEELFTERIDEYSSLIEKSVLCDDIVWHWIGSSCGSHTTWENNVRALKYFSNTRLDYLCNTYNCHKESTYSPKRLSMRSVDFIIDDNTIITKQYNDYETIDFNELAKSLNLPKGNWILAHSEEKINQYFPIIEDCTIKFIPAE